MLMEITRPIFLKRIVAGLSILGGALAMLGLPGISKTAFAGAPLVQTPGQLPRQVVPRHYSISLSPNAQAQSFEGTETIEVDVREPTRRIVLNALELDVSGARLEAPDLPADIAFEPKQQQLILSFPQTVGAGLHRLKLDFRGKINSTPQGLFATRYQAPGGQQKLLFCTQMEPTDARRVFPVWDEPAFRSTFELTVQVPEAFTAISNTPAKREQRLDNGLKRVEFEATPPMASYLVVLCAGEFETLSDDAGGVRIRVVATEGKKNQGRHALEALKKLLPYYADYFGQTYPLPKLDLIAVPGGLRGAMENWGGITFNEAILLFDPERSSQRTKEYVFSILAHEVAHQWFGNLVTMAWWDDLWLNEGFATWMQTKATDHFNPAWQLWPRADRSKQEAMDVDARRTTHPIQQPVRDPAEAARAFDPITYAKAAAIIRMLEAYVGEETFRAGVRRYMADHRFGNATTNDLWAGLEQASGSPIRSVAARWIEQPGLPVITLRSECRRNRRWLDLAQARFAIDDPAAPPLRWPVPITFFELGDPSVHTYLLKEPGAEVRGGSCAAPVLLNAHNTGYYRVQYAPADRETLLRQFPQLPADARLSLLDDTWALVYADRTHAGDYLGLLDLSKNETDLSVWEQVTGTLAEIDRLQRGLPGRERYRDFARTLLRPAHERLGWDAKPGEAETEALLRVSLLSALGHLGDEAVVAEARRRFAAFLSAETSLAPNLRATVFGIVGRYADPNVYRQLHELARKTDSIEQKQLLYGAMAAAQDANLARETLDLALTDELEPNLAASLVPKVANDGEQPELAWDFLKAHPQAVLGKVSLFGRFRYMASMASAFNDRAQAGELIRFSTENLPPEVMPEIRKAAERIEFRDRLRQREVLNIDRWIRRRDRTG
jgi:aminopeptidase N